MKLLLAQADGQALPALRSVTIDSVPLEDLEDAAARCGPYDVALVQPGARAAPALPALRCLRARGLTLPTLVLLAGRVGAGDEVALFQAGADDVLAGPAAPEPLTARLRALARRSIGVAPGAPVRCGPLELEPDRRTARWHGRAIRLTPYEFGLLEQLISRAGQVVSEERLLCAHDRDDHGPLRVAMCRLRRKLVDAGAPPATISSRPRQGYLLRMEVRLPDSSRAAERE